MLLRRRIGILGAGAQARELVSYLEPGADLFWAVTRDCLDIRDDRQIDIERPSREDRQTAVVAGVGAPGLRRTLVEAWPGRKFIDVIAPASYVHPSCQIGQGCVISPGAVLSIDVVVGIHCQINIGATLSHDVTLGSFVTIGPGAHISGGVKLGDGVFVGAGAVVVNAAAVAPGVVIGAGAVVLSDVTTPNAVVVGTPAKILQVRKDWLDAI